MPVIGYVENAHYRGFIVLRCGLHLARVLLMIEIGRGMQMTCSGLDFKNVPTSTVSVCKHWVCKHGRKFSYTQYSIIVSVSKGFGPLVSSSLLMLIIANR